MFEQPENPWQLREEELPSSFRFTVPESQSKGRKPLFTSKRLLFILVGLVFGLLWVAIQAYILSLEDTIAFDPESLPKVSTNKLVVVPSPIRYNLLQAPTPKEEPLPTLALSPLPSNPMNSILPASYTSGVLPPELGNPVPPPPLGPSFKLVGTAQGSDGSVATLKVDDEATGTKNQLQDAREGTTILDGYLVTKITPEYVLIKDKKAGKTIRVE